VVTRDRSCEMSSRLRRRLKGLERPAPRLRIMSVVPRRSSIRYSQSELLFGGRFCVDPFGNLYGCSKLCTSLGPGQGVAPLGNIFQGFTRPDNRLKCLDRTDRYRLKCQACDLNKVCSGGCPATNQADSGNY
jgi:radical SAM protein with 4Fe4S-binding SPASM domain